MGSPDHYQVQRSRSINASEDGHAHVHSSGGCGHGHGQHHDHGHGHGHGHDDNHHHGADDDAGDHSSALANKSWRYWFVLIFQLGFCLAELVVAILTRSLALLSEAFHNIGDVVSLLIAMYVERVKGGARTDAFSFGMRRAEVVGAMLNGTALLALCFFVVLEAIPRFFQPVDIASSGWLFITTASVGLLVNMFGAFCFSGHGHSHGLSSSGHDHGCGSHAAPVAVTASTPLKAMPSPSPAARRSLSSTAAPSATIVVSHQIMPSSSLNALLQDDHHDHAHGDHDYHQHDDSDAHHGHSHGASSAHSAGGGGGGGGGGVSAAAGLSQRSTIAGIGSGGAGAGMMMPSKAAMAYGGAYTPRGGI